MSIPTLDTSHVDYESVYEPAEDSFLMLDILETQLLQENSLLSSLIVLEIGSGSGVLLGGLASALGKSNAAYFATDLNLHACSATQRTGDKASIPLHAIRTDILSGLDRLQGCVDVLLCNPPYVATSEDEKSSGEDDLIMASWAGGPKGRNVTDKVLRLCKDFLTPLTGKGFIVLEQCNDVESVLKFAREDLRLRAEICGERKAGRERSLSHCIAPTR
eukprot:TRINITY_DN6422_c0_g1_i1.p1 TRINITY_DN6422_c0_g1~~TRINITY_DN6422_c0_g1_i1.p1  ORF type:complete len:218 (+),score=23.86 TRINITY_DN6422_c0_g1_i1:418-1071(+)